MGRLERGRRELGYVFLFALDGVCANLYVIGTEDGVCVSV